MAERKDPGPQRMENVRSWLGRTDRASSVAYVHPRYMLSAEEIPQITSYDNTSLLRYELFWTTRGTVFENRFIWLQVFIMIAMSCGICVCVLAISFMGDSLANLDLSDLEAMTNYMSSLTGFVLGLFVSLALTRWWAMRSDCLGELWNAITDVNYHMAVGLGGNTSPMAQEIRKCTTRYGLLSHSLIFKTAQALDDDLDDLIEQQLLTESEAELLRDQPSKPEAVWVWMHSIFLKAANSKELGSSITPVLGGLTGGCHRARNAINKVYAYTGTPLPLAYVHILALTVKLNFIMLVLQAGIETGVAIQNGNAMLFLSNSFLLIVIPIVYQGLLEIQGEIRNPFGSDRLDFPQKLFELQIQEQCDTYYDSFAKAPVTEF